MTNHAPRGSNLPVSIQKTKSRGSWPEVYKWLATGTLVVYTAVGSKTVTPAYAQTGNANSAATQTQALVVRHFEIPAGPLDGVLAAFENATELQIVVTQPEIRNVQSPGVSGTYTTTQALQLLLKDTNVSYKFDERGKVTLEFTSVN